MKNLLLLFVAALTSSSCHKSDSANPAAPAPSIIHVLSFSHSDSLAFPTPPTNDTLSLSLSSENISLGNKVVISATLKKGQYVNFICNDFVIQNLKYLPLVADHNTTLLISVYPFAKSSSSASLFYDTFVSVYDTDN